MSLASRVGGQFDRILRTPEIIGEARAAATVMHAEPVILVPGYCSLPEYLNTFQRTLQHDGYHAYVFDVPHNGLGDAREAADQLGEFVAEIRAKHVGADGVLPQVHLVGHSRGGMIATDAAHRVIERGAVRSVQSVSTPHNGIQVPSFMKGLSNSWLMDRVVPQSRHQLMRDHEYVASLEDAHRQLAADGVYGSSIYATRFDGAVQPHDAHVAAQGWRNIGLDISAPFPHLTMMTHESTTYGAVTAGFAHSDVAYRTPVVAA